MSLGTLGKKLQRDLKANPKKGLLLLLMVCGAGYFWGPILKRWVGGKSGQPGAVAAAPVILDDPKPAQAVAGKFKAPSWEKLQEFLQQDGLTKPAALPAEFRDPFAILELVQETTPVAPEVNADSETKPTMKAKLTKSGAEPRTTGEPRKLELKVSVSIGSRIKFAMIEGGVYREGETFELGLGEKDDDKLPLVIQRIEAWGVLFDAEGETFKAEVPQPKLGKHDRIVRGTTVRGDE